MKIKPIRVFRPALFATVSCLILSQFSYAQTFEYDSRTSGNCSSGDDERPKQGSVFTGKKFGDVDPPSDKKRRKFALKSAEAALNAGYNYIIVTPLTAKFQADYKNVVTGGGAFSDAELVSRSYNHRVEIRQSCIAVDDVSAQHIMWSNALPEKIVKRSPGSELVDVRTFIEFIDPGNRLAKTPKSPKISENQYQNIGDRERLAEQYPVMAAAATCHSDLGPRSISIFKRHFNSRDRDAERQCLETYRTKAEAVKWADFPLFKSDTEDTVSTRGFVLNKPKTPVATSVTQASLASPDVWGAGWTDLSAELRTQSGAFLFNEDLNRYIVASNNLDENAVIDHAVYLAMGQNLRTRYSGISVTDETDKYRKEFEQKSQSIRNARQKELEKSRRANERNSGSSDRKIQYKIRDIEREQKRITEISSQNDEATIAQMKASIAAFPDAKFDEAALRAQLRNVREMNLQARQAKLQKLQAELAEMKAENLSRGSDIGTSADTVDFSTIRPSESYGADSARKGIYHAFENYQTVMIFKTGNLLNTGKCRDSYLLCADKLQAYNAIGPRIGKADFTPLSPPAGYEPYVNQ